MGCRPSRSPPLRHKILLSSDCWNYTPVHTFLQGLGGVIKGQAILDKLSPIGGWEGGGEGEGDPLRISRPEPWPCFVPCLDPNSEAAPALVCSPPCVQTEPRPHPHRGLQHP